MKKFASISLLFSILLICILFSEYINYFTDSSQKKIVEKYSAASAEVLDKKLNLLPNTGSN